MVGEEVLPSASPLAGKTSNAHLRRTTDVAKHCGRARSCEKWLRRSRCSKFAKSRPLVRRRAGLKRSQRASASDGPSAWWRAVNAVPIIREKQLRPNVFKTERKKWCLVEMCKKPARFPSAQRDTARLVPKLHHTRGHNGKKLIKQDYMFVWQLKTGLKFQIFF